LSGKKWTDEGRYLLLRAAELYERQWVLIVDIEIEGYTSVAISHAYRRLMDSKWAAPKGLKKPSLRIESEPEAIAKLILSLMGTTREGSFLPKILSKYLTKAPEVTEQPSETTDLERRVQSLVDKNKNLQNKLTQSFRDETLFQSLAQELTSSVKHFSAKPPSPAIIKTEDSTLVHGVALLSDEHGDALVDSASVFGLDHYDFNIFRARIEVWSRLIVDYVNVHLPKHNFEHLWIFKLGDGIQGDIHDSTKNTYFKNALKAAIAVGEIEAQALWWIHQKTGVPMTIISVSGNHPRRSLRKDYHGPQDNFDFLIATQIATRLADTPIQVCCPNSWTTFANTLGYIWAINHGDDVVGYAGHPWYGFDRKNQRVQALVARKGFRIDYFAYGHYHSDAKAPSAGAKSFHNGGWYFSDPYAINKLSVGENPQQNFYVVSEKFGVIFEIPVYLKDEETEDKVLEGKHEPAFGRDTILEQVLPPSSDEFIIQRA